MNSLPVIGEAYNNLIKLTLCAYYAFTVMTNWIIFYFCTRSDIVSRATALK